VIVSIENLSHRYGDRTALAGLTFQVEEGAVFGLLGPNGGGKSTLFRILATLMAPSGGRALVAGFDVERQPDAVRRRIGVVFQSQSLDRKLTVEENLQAQGHLYGMRGAPLATRIGETLERLGLAGRRRDVVTTLSGGLRRRAEIAKALLHRPRVLLMDEPSSGLDPGARRELADYIAELRGREGVTVLLTTHILDEAERCDRLLLLHEGKAVAQGSPAELKARIRGDVVAVEARNPDALAAEIRERFAVRVQLIDGSLRIETADGTRLISGLIAAFPDAMETVALHKPTLEDVFLDETGARLA
jgi:ABC-2 type transport system ATP-binding protein